MFQQDEMLASYDSQQSTFSAVTFLFAIILSLLIGYIFYQVKRQYKSTKSLVRKRFSSLALTEDKLALNLFRRHDHEPEKVITLASIKQCQLLLGDLIITTINTTLNHGFTAQQELEMREIFHTEQIDKMVDGKVRRISLVLNTRAKDNHIICLYLRKGSDRITKNSYFEVVDEAIDWCWIIAKYINSEHTGIRIVKPKNTALEITQAEHKSHDDTPLHAQAAIIRPATHPTQNVEDVGHLPVDVDSPIQIKDDGPQETTIAAIKVETDLVNAIEKLGKLQQQGLLSTNEFTQAKAKLLDSLNKTE